MKKTLDDNILKLEDFDKGNAEIIKKLQKIFDSQDAKNVANKIGNKLESFFEVKTNWDELGKSFFDPVSIMKISVYILLIAASFILNYRHTKKSIKNYEVESNEYNNNCKDSNQANETIMEISENHKNDHDDINEMTEINDQTITKMKEEYLKEKQTLKYKMAFVDILDFAIKTASFK